MRKFLLLLTICIISIKGFSQDQTNKGKEFWLVFPAHVASSAQAQMGLFITSDKNSSGTISVNGFNTTFTVVANQITGPILIPFANANVGTTNTVVNKGIHVLVDNGQPPVVLYAHIFAGFRSEASLILPVTTLGKKYYSTNFWQASTGGSQSQFNIVATEPNTVVQYQKRVNGVLSLVKTTVNLPNPGDQIQVQDAGDLTGSIIESIASGTGGCNRIAVFSGSSALSISRLGCNAGSFDPLFQQCYSVSTWGKDFGVVPFLNNPNGFHVRVMASEDNTTVNFNGTAVTLNAGEYYPATGPNLATYTVPMEISADKPISVSQYMLSANCSGSANFPNQTNAQGDPDMVILNPVEQNISDINLFSSNLQNIRTKYLSVYMKTAEASTFRINGNAPNAAFVPMPQNNGYSYLREDLTNYFSTAFRLQADSGFNAITYGMGDAESYAYSAGTNVKDLNQQLEVEAPNSIELTPNVCVGSQFKFKVYLPNKTSGATPTEIRYDSIRWDCSNTGVMTPGNFPVVIHGAPTVTPDSINIRNTREVAWYSIPGQYSFNTPGTYQITITVYRTSTEGCGNEQDYTFDLVISEPPPPSFAVTTAPGCYLEPVFFEETTPQLPKPTYRWYWDFGDPASGAANISTLKSPNHTFSGPGNYNIKFVDVTTPGCVSDTVRQTINIPDIPDATISGTTAVCINAASPTITITGSGGKLPYEIVYSINGVPQPPVTTATGIYTITNVPTNVAVPVTYSLVSIKNFGSAVCARNINGQSATVTVNPNATLTYLSGPVTQTVCINSPITPVVYTTGNGSTGGALIVTPLNPGFNGTYGAATNSYTITGTPTVPGVYTLVLKPVGPCVDPAEPGQTMTITVNANATLNLAPTSGTPSPTLCINTPVLSPIVYDVGGGATGANVVFTPVLPAGITWNYNAATKQVTILGTPTVSGTYSFLVSTISTCTNPTPIGGTITINPDATIALTSLPATTNQTKCVNTNIAPIVYAIDGSVTSVTVNNLPPGVTYTYTPGTPGSLSITGAPTTNVGSPFNYTVVLAGPCQLPTPQTGVINVNPDAGITLISPTASPTICINNAINITYQVTGSVTAVNFTGTLPAGVTYVYTPGNPGSITIAGTPTASGPFNYNIALTGICQVPLPVSGLITVTPDATIGLNAGSLKNQAVCVNTPIATISYSLGGSATGGAVTFVPPLPGVTGTVTGNAVTILGTPTVVSNVPLVYTYHVVTTGPCVNPDSTGTITVNPDHVLNLNAGSLANQTVCSGIQIAPINYTMDGGATGVTVTGLPAAGLTYTVVGNLVTIIGAPTANVTYSFTTTGNGCKTVTKGGTITVVPLPTPDFSFTTPSCNTRTISFTDNTVPNAGTLSGWVWNFGDATPLSNIQNPTHSYLLPGTYTVSLVATTSPNGCSNAAPFTKQVVINERPKTDFTVPAIACVNDIALFNDASTSPITNTPFNAAGYKWDFGDPASGASNTQTGVMNGTHQFSAGGTYTVTHISESSAGCRDTITHTP